MSRSRAEMPDHAFPLSSENWQQVQNLLAEVLERPAGARRAFLRRTCGHDRALYREVESLLTAYDEAGAFLESLDTEAAAALMTEETGDDAVGTVVGPYRIVSTLGRGGMGVVYRAEDTRLERSVALKFLPPSLAADDGARRRLLAEARAAAALDHVHIGVVHEISETDDGRPFIAMAHYDGETLREKISRGPLQVAEIVRLAGQIAEGLQAAHRRGIVHRDVKPSNILITSPDSEPGKGAAKIVDFGIARLMDAERTDRTATPGTVAYMSPEQTRGDAVDQRTDVWSLGVVLYEMLTGRRPFQGASSAALVHSILQENPEPIAHLRSGVPAGLEAVVKRCLAKDPEARCRSAAEVIEQLDSLSTNSGATAKSPAASATGRLSAAVLLVVLIGAGIAVIQSVLSSTPPRTEPPRRVLLTSYPGVESMPSFSPDGKQVAFAWNGGDGNLWDLDVYLKSLEAGAYDPVRLTSHPDVDYAPAWSPDGRHIAFLRHTIDAEDIGIYRVSVEGSSAQRVTALRIPSSVSWSPDGTSLVFVDVDSSEAPSAVYAFSLETLKRRKLTYPPSGVEDLDARISPDGTMLAFVRGRRHMPVLQNLLGDVTNGSSDLHVVPLPDGTPRRLTFDGSTINGLTWTPDSREIVYASDRVTGYGHMRLWRVPVDGGESEPISSRGDRDVFPAVSPDGSSLAHVEAAMRRSSFWRYEIGSGRQALPEQLIYSSAREISAEYSPDGSRIVFASRRTGNDEIWVCDRDGRNPVQLTFLGGPRAGSPRWSPDGRFIAFDSWLDGGPRARIYVISSRGGAIRRVMPDSLYGGVPSWSRDGRWIYAGTADGAVWKFPVGEGRAVRVMSDGSSPRESPDGEWLYYVRPVDSESTAIWRRPVAGGEESLVMDRFRARRWGSWVVFDDGIYFFDGDGQGRHSVKFFDLATGKVTMVTELPEFGGYMHVSPDREHLLVRRMEGGDVDLVLTEDWR